MTRPDSMPQQSGMALHPLPDLDNPSGKAAPRLKHGYWERGIFTARDLERTPIRSRIGQTAPSRNIEYMT